MTPSSLVIRRASTSRSTRCSCSGSATRLCRGTGRGHGFAVDARFDQSQQQVAEVGPLVGGHLFVHVLRCPRDRTPDAAGGLIAGDGEGATLAPFPRLTEGVGQQGQRARFAFDFPHEEIDQPRFEQKPRLVCRALDRGLQIGLRHGTQEVQAPLDEAGEAGLGRRVAEPVGPHRHHHRRSLGPLGEGGEEPGSFVRVAAQRERLFALVDDEHQIGSRIAQAGEGLHRVRARA